MPYTRDKKCVYKKNADNSRGKKKGCSDTEAKAKKYIKKLYSLDELDEADLDETDPLFLGGGGYDETDDNAGMKEMFLREWIRGQLMLNEVGFTAAEIGKDGQRFNTLLTRIKDGVPVNIEGKFKSVYGNTVIIPEEGNAVLIAALEAQDKNAYAAAFPIKIQKTDGVITDLATAGHLAKAGIVKGSREGGVPLSIRNELDFAAFIAEVATDEEPITVIIGDYVIDGVTGARQTGSEKVDGKTSKADVVLTQCKGVARCDRISLKLDTAAYWLSGDSILAPDFGPIVQRLLGKQPPEIRMTQSGDRYVMMSGESTDPADKISRIWFEIPEAMAQRAVFGSDENTAQIVAKGNFTLKPTWDENTRTVTWSSGIVYKSLADIPDSAKPVGVFRNSGDKSTRGIAYNGVKYTGIRPVIASKGFASGGNSREVSMNEQSLQDPASPLRTDEFRQYAISQLCLMETRRYAKSQVGLLRERLIIEELAGSDRSEIKRMIKKEIEGATNKREIEKAFKKKFDVELKKALGTSFLGTPGKINKFVIDQIYDEVNKWLADSATRNEIAEITKQVLVKLYRELSFSSPTIIKRIKV